MDIRTRLLDAAARTYAELGYRGATTRRIAHEAEVSEITLFRHFGSKESLILEALTQVSRTRVPTLPDEPVDPRSELIGWCRSRFDTLHRLRSLLRKVMGEVEEHPEIIKCAQSYPHHPVLLLEQYVRRLRERGLASPGPAPMIAASLLVGAIFTEALVRDMMPELYPYEINEAIDGYVDLFLRGIGATVGAAAGPGSR